MITSDDTIPPIPSDPPPPLKIESDGPKKTVHIYPFIEDTPVFTFEVDSHTDINVQADIIKKKYSLPQEIHKIGFMYYTPDRREKVIPFDQLSNVISSFPGDVFLRLYNYLPHERIFTNNENNQNEDPWENDTYFAGYSYMQIHWEMLSDVRRCSAYAKAIYDNGADFKDKIVLDVGCGTGILSVFAAKAGAKKVYGVDASDVVHKAELVVKANNFQNVIEIIHGKIEEITLPVDKVDIIVSEWMGYFLIFESMLECVLFARDKWLKPDGLIFPCFAKLYMAPINFDKFYKERIMFWEKEVEGVNLTPLINFAKDEFLNARCLRSTEIQFGDLLCDGSPFKEINLYNTTVEQIRTTRAVLVFKKTSDHKEYHGYGTWFEVIFEGTDKSKAVSLTTHPKEPKTHWRQDCWLFRDPVPISDEPFQIGIEVTQMKWKRHFNVHIVTKIGDKEPAALDWAI
jgi:protein arginine N-methyltransferase 1